MRILRPALAATLVAFAGMAQTPSLFDQIKQRLTANALRADVSFLASDALEGRGTPSKGLDIAAEFVASQFRRAGLETAGDDGYFQTALYNQMAPNAEGMSFTLEIGGRSLEVAKTAMSVQENAAIDLSKTPV